MLYEEIYKYNRKKISDIIQFAFRIVLAFAASTLAVNIAGGKVVPAYGDLDFWTRAGILGFVYVFSWAGYFHILGALERQMLSALNEIKRSGKIDDEEYRFARESYMEHSKSWPFSTSPVLLIAVVAL